jgi:beta-lactamase regulating signal transducer with metallopeptidase domain
MNDLLAMFVPLLGAALIGFLWQGAVIGLLAWLALALLRDARPQARYAVACAALFACVLAPAWQLLRMFSGSAAQVQAVALRATIDPVLSTQSSAAFAFDALPSLPDVALPWIVALWATGAGVLALRMVCGLLWVRRLRAGSTPYDRDGWQARLDRLSQRFGIRRTVALRIITDGDSPLSAGWWKPVVLVPAALALRMPAHLLEALLAHELAHIRRHDYLVNLLQGAVEILLFYHPVVWWLSRRIRIEREQVADHIAATVLGEPRRLAVALSELDRYAIALPAFAQAAHGGQLMSRIQQLVRPDRRAVGGIVALPLVGLVAAGIAFYAHARFEPAAATAEPATLAAVATQAEPAPAPRSAQASQSAPMPKPAPMPQPAPAPQPAPTPESRPSPRPTTGITLRSDDSRAGYALVRKDREGFSMSGDLDDVDAIRAARRSIDGDFIWFRRDGKAYVVRDAALLTRAVTAWQPTDALNAQMQSLNARMEPHNKKMEILGKRMESLAGAGEDDSAMGAAAAEIGVLGSQQGALGARQAALAQRLAQANDAEREQLQREMEALDAQQRALEQQMKRHSEVLAAQSERMQAKYAPMEALGREMEAAGKPMEAIGKEMEVLGKQIEQKAAIADGEIRQVIAEAVARGLATPVPSNQ